MRELGEIESAAEGILLRVTRPLEASPGEVWSALTERDALDGWLGRMSYEPEVGSRLTIDFGEGIEIHGEVLAYEPPRLFSFSWSSSPDLKDASRVRFELRPAAEGTTLVLTHSRQSVEMARGTAAGWHAHLDMLIAQLEGSDVPAWEQVYPPAREAYAALVEGL